VLLPTLTQGTALLKSMANLHTATEMFAGVVNNANSQFLPAARAQQLRSAAVNVLSKPFIALQSAGQDETQAINAATARATTVDPATTVTAPIRARTLAKWDAADIPGKAAMITNLSMEGLAALHESGELDELPSDLRKIATDRYMIQRHIAKTGLQANFQKQPDANNPLATGPDVEAATAAAQKAVDALKGRSCERDVSREKARRRFMRWQPSPTMSPARQQPKPLNTGGLTGRALWRRGAGSPVRTALSVPRYSTVRLRIKICPLRRTPR
jgi:hypothetical protein